ncbi:MAG: glycosyltransferase family 9 protein [bacterium]
MASERILVIRLRRVGDLLLLTPTLKAIRKARPEARIDLLAQRGFHRALEGSPLVDHLLILDPGLSGLARAFGLCRAGRYGITLDLQSSPRSVPFVLASGAPVRVGWKKRAARDWVYSLLVPGWNAPIYLARNFARMAELIGVPSPEEFGLEFPVSSADRARADEIFRQGGIRTDLPVVALSPVAKVPRKQWHPGGFARTADLLIRNRGAQIVLTGGPKEQAQIRAVVTRMQEKPALWDYGDTSLKELAALYERCHLWIGNDGGPKHIATSAGCPTVVVLRAGDEKYWTDCGRDADQQAVTAPPGPGRHDHLENVRPEQVLEAALPLLGRRMARGAAGPGRMRQ